MQVVQLAPPVLIRRAIAHYNGRLAPGKRPAEITSNEAFLKRLCVNWLRHTGSNYDAQLRKSLSVVAAGSKATMS